ncbi:MAG: NADPH-dependent FMN reductase [Dermatophilaceae bacterium]
MNILVLLGSLRTGSTNRQLIDHALTHLPDGATATVFECLADLPHYSGDLDHDDLLPDTVRDLRAAVAGADGLLLVTPEYNGSMSSAVKNAVDWASRPRSAASIAGTPAAVIGASASPRGAQWAREDAVKVLRVAGADVIEDTVGVGSSYEAFENGRLVDAELDAEVRALIIRLADAAHEKSATAA